jgi:signal transduction histidine kinase
MSKLSLGTRLFLSHLLAMIVGLGSFVIIAKLSSPNMFVLRLEQLERRGFFTLGSARTFLIDGFQFAWNRSAFWSFLFGTLASAGFSYIASKRIVRPLKQMKTITHNFAAGNLNQRMPGSTIPELHQLSNSFNRMASSLEDVEKRRRELISDLSHELRTPLTVVRGYLEELANNSIEPSPELYDRLVRETRHLERLIRDLQELSKAEAGHLSINLQTLSLKPLLESLVQKFADQLLEDGPILTLNCPSDLPPVMADLDRTQQILVNLLGNAIRYTEKGSIAIDVWQDKDRVWTQITDTGIGISKEDLPFVFERFWRADRSRSRYSGGSGIGLAISRRLVELQGGQIEAESELGKGSKFRFFLPVSG